MMMSRVWFLRKYFALFGYTMFCVVAMAVLLEFGAFAVWSICRLVRPDPQLYLASASPGYAAYKWAPEFWNEERSRWRSRAGNYLPFRIWGAAPWHGKFVNTDETSMGTWRRTINYSGPECAGGASVNVWMFGGSTLYGSGVPDWATLPSFLSRNLNGVGRRCVSVVNFGVEGYATNQEVILLIEQLKAGRRPDIVIFYDGVNDSYAGAVSPGISTAHLNFLTIKARVEGSAVGRLDFLRDSYAFQLAKETLHLLGPSHPSTAVDQETNLKAQATLDNYEGNLRVAKALAGTYGYQVYCFWQPSLIYGHKPLDPFERQLMSIAAKSDGGNAFRAMAVVYRVAEQRAVHGPYVFLGNIFDTVRESLYIDKWMHLNPTGNELAAQAIAKRIEDQLRPSSN